MEKTIYIPGDFVMTNGIPIGTKKGIVGGFSRQEISVNNKKIQLCM